MTSDKREIEIGLEDWMIDYAHKRIKRDSIKAQRRGAWADSLLGKKFTAGYSRPFISAVEAFVSQSTGGKAGRGNRAAELLRRSDLEPSLIAFLFVKGLFNMLPALEERALKKSRLSVGAKRPSLCIYAVGLIHDEWRIRVFASVPERKKLLKVIMEDMEKRGYPRHWKLRTIRNQFKALKVEWEGWNQKEKAQIGHALLTLFMACYPKLLTHPVNADGKPDKSRLEGSQEFYDRIEKLFNQNRLAMLLYRPMVIPPKPWSKSHPWGGGYITDSMRPYEMIKGTKRKDESRLMSADLHTAYRAINALQETPFRLNRRVYEVFSWVVRERRGGIAGIAETEKIPLPERPWNYDTDEAVKKAHNHRIFLLHDKNRQNKSKTVDYVNTLAVADRYKDFEEFYFPHFFDHRGRTYPKTQFLQPQSADYSKAMLEFARGREINTPEARDWLAIAGANAYGNDKVSLADRVKWVVDNGDLITSVAADPYTDLRWTHAAEPFQFLRFCFEWSDFLDHWPATPFVSHMVIPVDATCSGLQHYAAMLADEVGGRSVNLVPGLSRQDVYGDVAARVIELLKGNDCDEARALLRFGVDRKTVKRQVMVVPYAATMSSCMGYTREAITEKLDSGVKPEWDTSDRLVHNTHIVLLSKTIWEAIQDVVLKGREAMQWLSATARAWSKWANENSVEDPAIEWTLPDGFPVRHVVFEETKIKVASFVDGGIRTGLTLYEPTKKVSSTDMATSFPPNFIHSYDACHLRMSIVRALDLGITDFDMVHDSFGVHAACMTDFLTKCVKPAFIDMYGSSDRLREFRESLPPDLDLPPLPERGSLDLTGVADSEFFFS